MGRWGGGQACSAVSSPPATTQPSPAQPHPSISRAKAGQGPPHSGAPGAGSGAAVGFKGDKIPMVALGTECWDTDDRSRPVTPVQSAVPLARLTPSPRGFPAQSPADCAFRELTGYGQALEDTAEPALVSERNGTNSGLAELSMRPRAGEVLFEPLSAP